MIEFPEQMQAFIHNSEQVAFSVKTTRDVAIFTDKRILIVEKQGITGKKVEYYSLPYRNIVTYSIETAGTFDLDSEIELVLGSGVEVELRFFRDKELNGLMFKAYHLINDYVLMH